MNKINPTIARLDRSARRLGLSVTERGVNTRVLVAPALKRSFRYRPGGKGVVRVEAFVDGRPDADAVAFRTVESMEALMLKVSGRRG